MYRIQRISHSVTTYRDCGTYSEARAELDRLEHAMRYTGVHRPDSDRLLVGLNQPTLVNEFRIVHHE